MPARSSARLLAPLALIACFIALVVVIGGGSGGGSETRKANKVGQRNASVAKKRAKPKKRPDYVIKQGDLLDTIAKKTGVPLERIQALNPKLDPQTLVPGQRVKLAP